MSADIQQTVQIKGLRVGQQIEASFWVVDKTMSATRERAPLLKVTVKDRTGRILGKAFGAEALRFAERFEDGDPVKLQAIVETRNGARQLKLLGIEKTSADKCAALPPATRRDVDDLDGYFEYLASEVVDPDYGRLLEVALQDESMRAAFRRAPCTPKPSQGTRVPRGAHHSYQAGALEHTVVATLIVQRALATYRERLSQEEVDLAITASLLCDVGLARAFQQDATFTPTEEGRLLTHESISMRMIDGWAAQLDDFPDEHLLMLQHCVERHHNPPGARFASIPAKAVYLARRLDAEVKAMFEHDGEADIDPSPRARPDRPALASSDEMLVHFASLVHHRGYADLLDAVVANRALSHAWHTGRCTRAGHHRKPGGLLQHSTAVAAALEVLCEWHPRLNSDLAITAALLHDIGKVRELDGAELTLVGRLLHHEGTGLRIVHRFWPDSCSEEDMLALAHCIERHHDRSGKGAFATPEALALFLANELDLGVEGALYRKR